MLIKTNNPYDATYDTETAKRLFNRTQWALPVEDFHAIKGRQVKAWNKVRVQGVSDFNAHLPFLKDNEYYIFAYDNEYKEYVHYHIIEEKVV